MKKLYIKFIKPSSDHPDQAEREIVLNYLLIGIIGLSIVALADTLLQYAVTQESYFTSRIIGIIIVICIFVLLYFVARYKQQNRLVAIILTIGITALASLVVFQWGILVPTAIALYSLAIVMGGVLISARYSVYVASAILVIIASLQYAQASNYWQPNTNWMKSSSTTGDVIGFSAIFFVIALVSWLFNRQMELSLKRARHSEKALKHQKDLLEIKVEQRARQLEAAQLEKMQELYRFAELGRLSTALFHDLANHLTSVNIDIEGLESKGQSGLMKRIGQNVTHIDTIVKRVRKQIQGKNSDEVFDIHEEIDEVMSILASSARQARVQLVINTDKSVDPGLLYVGDVVRFRQIILNLVSNAIEAYLKTDRSSEKRLVSVVVSRQKTIATISVSDHGTGIKARDKLNIFKPFFTTKDKGAGVGLFLVKQIVEDDFGGTLELTSNNNTTVFSANLPKSYYGSKHKT